MYDAIILGVNTIIFTAALTAGMLLMGTINEMVEYTKINIESPVGGNLTQEYGDEAKRTFTGAEVFAVYGQMQRGEIKDKTIKVKVGASTTNILDYGANTGISHISDTFILKCTDEKNYFFELLPD